MREVIRIENVVMAIGNFLESGRRGRILVADDIELNRTVTGLVLSAANYEVDTVADGQAAVRAVRQAPYDLVLMDIDMPGLDGFEATRAIRCLNGRSDLAIVAWSARRDEADSAEAEAAGMNEHIVRPIEPKALVAAIERILAAKRYRSAAEVVLCPHINATLVALLGQDRMNAFFDQLAVRLDAMLALSRSRSEITDAIVSQAHDLKSSAGMLGFTEVSRCCGALETRAPDQTDERRLSRLAAAIERAGAMIALLRAPTAKRT